MTPEQMLARISELESELKPKPRKARVGAGSAKAAKAAERARKAQFKLEALKRSRLHCSLNRYHCN